MSQDQDKSLDPHSNPVRDVTERRENKSRSTGEGMDISERQPAEEQLRLCEQKQKAILNTIPDPAWLKDKEGRYIAVNAAWCQFTGLAADGALGKTKLDLFPAETAEKLEKEDRDILLAGKALRQEQMLHDYEGRPVWFDTIRAPFRGDDNQIMGIVGISRNITARKQAEETLINEKARMQQYLDIAGVILLVLDREGNILLLNRKGYEILEYPEGELIGRNWIETCLPERERKRLAADFQRLMAGDLPLLENFENSILTRTGKERLIAWHNAAIFDAAGMPISTLSSGQDITEQAANREHLDLLQAELAHAGRLTAMGELASGIAHEVSQPLSVVTIWAEVARRQIVEELRGNKQESLLALARISEAIERAGNIVHRMKDFARKSAMQKLPLSMNEAMREIYPLVEHQLRFAGVNVVTDLDPALPAVLADRAQMQQVFFNLIRNALDAMENTAPDARRLIIRGQVSGGMLEVLFQDAGCGIDRDELESVFLPFHTTKPEGMGLGLSICRTIIENHGGKIWAIDCADGGATIALTLPLAEAPA